jgi:hypothetical protein
LDAIPRKIPLQNFIKQVGLLVDIDFEAVALYRENLWRVVLAQVPGCGLDPCRKVFAKDHSGMKGALFPCEL